MLFQVLKYDVFRDGTVGGREIPSAPKVTAPVAFFDLREFALDFVGRPALHQPHQITDRQFRRDRYEHMDVIAGQDALDDLDAILCTDLSADVPDADAQLTCEYFETVLRRPDEVVSVIIHAMLAA